MNAPSGWIFAGLGVFCIVSTLAVGALILKKHFSRHIESEVTNQGQITETANTSANGSRIDQSDALDTTLDFGNAEVRACREFANAGDAHAQYNLGVFYDKGMGVTQNKVEAAKWFRKSADQGIADAQYNLGLYYYQGVGVTQNKEKAARLFRKAADQGDSEAKEALELCLVATGKFNNTPTQKELTVSSTAYPQSVQQQATSQDDSLSVDPRTISNPYMTTDLYGPAVSGRMSSISKTELDLFEKRGLSEQQSIYTVMLIHKFGFNVPDVLAEWDDMNTKQEKFDGRRFSLWDSFGFNAFLAGKKNRDANK